ncbi:hypothetical protein LSH36_770g01008 [Paralvinella palmiformis]|uniref:Seryl-tRNA synthetase n=1 Tax=Paralvinella palmiformis TaxID=53620 RepID=A0AAD9J1I6_9ANNE|nr:hypothetical protein LSH36_770g01008 [Paralvinella palmiformis]
MNPTSWRNLKILCRWPAGSQYHQVIIRRCPTAKPVASWHTGSSNTQLNAKRQMSSVLYPGHFKEGSVLVTEVDLNLKSRFKNIRALFENVRARKMSEKVNVYHLASMYKTLTEVEKKKNELDAERQQNSDQMKLLLKVSQTDSVLRKKEELIARGKEIRENLREVNKYYYDLEEEVILYALQLPSDLHPSTSEVDDKVLREIGSIKSNSSRKPVGHMLIGRKTGTIFRKNVGPVQCYLRKNVANLEQEISYRVGVKLRQLGFTQVSCPDMVKTIIVEGTGQDITDPQTVYVLQEKKSGDDSDDENLTNRTLHLVGASPQVFAVNSHLILKYLPDIGMILIVNISSSSSHVTARNTPGAGLFSVPQCNVVEVFGVAKDERDASALYDEFQTTFWNLYQVLSDQMPIRLVARCARNLTVSEAGHVDVQAWSYSQQQFVTVGSVSLWSDFLSRRLMTMWSTNVNRLERGHFVHTVHGTAVNITTLVGLLMEAYQTSDGNFKISEDLMRSWSADIPV